MLGSRSRRKLKDGERKVVKARLLERGRDLSF